MLIFVRRGVIRRIVSAPLCLFLTLLGSVLWAHTDVTPQVAHDMIDSNADLIIIDVREFSDYCGLSGHVPGAYNYPWNSGVLESSYADLPQHSEILVVCRSGGRSHLAASFLDSKGYLHIYDMLGGTNSWKDTYGYETADCIDSDGDGFNDDLDNCPGAWNPLQTDSDGDHVGNNCDICQGTYNPSQTDSDGDGIGNTCDGDCPDLDGLNPVNIIDFAILTSDWLITAPGLMGDLVADGTVDINDLVLLAEYWLSDCY